MPEAAVLSEFNYLGLTRTEEHKTWTANVALQSALQFLDLTNMPVLFHVVVVHRNAYDAFFAKPSLSGVSQTKSTACIRRAWATASKTCFRTSFRSSVPWSLREWSGRMQVWSEAICGSIRELNMKGHSEFAFFEVCLMRGAK